MRMFTITAWAALWAASSWTGQARADESAATPIPQDVATWVPGEVIVGFRHDPDELDLGRISRVIRTGYEWRAVGTCASSPKRLREGHPLRCVRVITLAPGVDASDAADEIARMPGIAYAHPNYITHPAYSPNDPYYITRQYAPLAIRADEAWDITTGSRNVVIAVADTGLRLDHEDLRDSVWLNDDAVDGSDDDQNGYVDDFRGWDFINHDNDPFDTSGHGTHVAGIIAAGLDNGIGVAGMCDGTIMPLQVFSGGSGTWEAIAEAITYAVDNGASVLNYSGGGFGGHGLLAQAVQYAYENDMTLVAATGNHGSATPYYPAAYSQTIAVSATGANDVYYASSGRGPYVDVAAPGMTIWSTDAGHSADYAFKTGTSMATAHVTGLVALMYSLNPDLHVEEVRTLLHENAVDLGDPGFDERFGWGRIDARATLGDVPVDVDPPYIVHDDGVSTHPYTGYIDPRAESSDGAAKDLGIDRVTLTFSEPVRDRGAAEGLTPAAFTLTGTAAELPAVVAVDAGQNPTILIELSGPIPPGQWTTIIAAVEDLSGNPIEALGDMGPGVDEPDRLDLGFLPCDVDQNEVVSPFDLLQFRRIVQGQTDPPQGVAADYVDIDRSGDVDPFDLLNYRQLVQGAGSATRVWAGERLPPRP